MEMQPKKSRVMWVCSAAALCCVIWGAFHVINTEDMHFARNSPWYYLLIDSPLIEQVPTGNCEAMYHSSVGDGNKPPAQGIALKCAEFPDRAITKVVEILRRHSPDGDTVAQPEEIRQRALAGRYDFEGQSEAGGSISFIVRRSDSAWHLSLTQYEPPPKWSEH